MSVEFHKFPSTPHLTWLGSQPLRDDKVLTPSEAADFLNGEVVAEEKIDGANLGISVGADGQLQFQNRGNNLHGSLSGQWKPLRGWAIVRLSCFLEHLSPSLILFGEWCYATHSIAYTRLPDWFLAFDVFDTRTTSFWSTSDRNALAEKLGLFVVPKVFEGRTNLATLTGLALQSSAFSDSAREGIYLRRESRDGLQARAKLVNPMFTQAIGEHWSRGMLRTNQLSVCPPSSPKISGP